MDIKAKIGDLGDEKCDVLAVFTFSDASNKKDGLALIDQRFGGKIKIITKEEHFSGNLGESVLIRPEGEVQAKRVLVLGLGKQKAFDEETLRQGVASAVCSAKALKAKSLCFSLVIPEEKPSVVSLFAQAASEGALLGNYEFLKYKKEKLPPVSRVTIISGVAKHLASMKKGIAAGTSSGLATIFARELVNTPGEHMKPKDLVDAAKRMVKGKKRISIKVFDETKLKEMGAGGILGVNQGSDHEPFMVHMVYKPMGKAKKKVALVGKAVTFDTGGLSLKPSNAMETMKLDMAGAAAVLGAFHAITELSPKAEVHGIFGAVENMPSGRAIRPGDVVTALNGKTIEILNTDAEGRVTLADTLSYAVKQKPDMIIDVATLTGACLVALGEEITGVMSNNRSLALKVLDAAKTAGEKMWELPLEKNYAREVKSDFADVKNLGGKWGGALTAGLFLEEFVDNVPWAHLDIAGPSYAERPMNAYMRKGATGHGVRTLIEFLRSI